MVQQTLAALFASLRYGVTRLMCVCVCACACARVYMCVHVFVFVHVSRMESNFQRITLVHVLHRGFLVAVNLLVLFCCVLWSG